MSLFMFLRDNLPTAMWGYYPARNTKHEVTDLERKKVKKILEPFNHYFLNEEIIETCFVCLLRALKAKNERLHFEYEKSLNLRKAPLEDLELEKLVKKFTDRNDLKDPFSIDELENVEFKFKSKDKIILKGYFADFLFEMLFRYYDSLDVNIMGHKDTSLSLNGILYLKSRYNEEISNKKKKSKRNYKKKYTSDEYHEMTVKSICKELHNFLKINTQIIPKGSQTSTNELKLISDFISLSKLENIDSIEVLRNWITR